MFFQIQILETTFFRLFPTIAIVGANNDRQLSFAGSTSVQFFRKSYVNFNLSNLIPCLYYNSECEVLVIKQMSHISQPYPFVLEYSSRIRSSATQGHLPSAYPPNNSHYLRISPVPRMHVTLSHYQAVEEERICFFLLTYFLNGISFL